MQQRHPASHAATTCTNDATWTKPASLLPPPLHWYAEWMVPRDLLLAWEVMHDGGWGAGTRVSPGLCLSVSIMLKRLRRTLGRGLVSRLLVGERRQNAEFYPTDT